MISVIVPVYNVAPYLPRCIDSILAQSFGDFELLLIDDGSTDASGAICDEYARKDKRIKVFHIENAGVSYARNYGMERARGDYIGFIDSDDYVGTDYLKILFEMMQGENIAIAQIRSVSTSAETMKFIASDDRRLVFDAEEEFKDMMLARDFGVSANGKLYRREVFDGHSFPVGKVYEDLDTVPYLIEAGRNYAYSSSVQYYYYQRQDSIMHSISPIKIDHWLEGIDKLYKFCSATHPELVDCVLCRFVNFAFSTIVNNLFEYDDYAFQANEFKARTRHYWKGAWKNPCLTKKERFRTVLFLVDVRLYRTFRKLWLKFKKSAF
ncbi:MAG: glycosyltransferase family 2 protein [Oscillospiraceae bacterium]|nr:glycosyltransferase family 2 protein [Oscillospiraceae bacterium]